MRVGMGICVVRGEEEGESVCGERLRWVERAVEVKTGYRESIVIGVARGGREKGRAGAGAP